MSSMNDTSPEKSAWGYKGLLVAIIIAATFMGFLYLAVSKDPDYMPSQEMKRQQAAEQQRLIEEAKARGETPPEPTPSGHGHR